MRVRVKLVARRSRGATFSCQPRGASDQYSVPAVDSRQLCGARTLRLHVHAVYDSVRSRGNGAPCERTASAHTDALEHAYRAVP